MIVDGHVPAATAASASATLSVVAPVITPAKPSIFSRAYWASSSNVVSVATAPAAAAKQTQADVQAKEAVVNKDEVAAKQAESKDTMVKLKNGSELAAPLVDAVMVRLNQLMATNAVALYELS